MKIAINYRPVDGPWGGGNRFVANLVHAAEAAGHTVGCTLSRGLDVILMVDPRTALDQVTFGPRPIFAYKALYPSTVVVHRINESDLRKGTEGVDAMLVKASGCADHVVFNGGWMRDLPAWRHLAATPERSSVIHDGADPAVFHPDPAARTHIEGPLRLVTHHWGANWRKGFDVYAHLDALMDDPALRDLFSLTYVGNLPDGFGFRNVGVEGPFDGAALADRLRAHDAYLTASLHEPSGNHHVEGALCGLPLVYRNSGGLPEYCAGFGVPFDGVDDVLAAIRGLKADFPRHKAAMTAYANTKQRCTGEYLALFDRLTAAHARSAGTATRLGRLLTALRY